MKKNKRLLFALVAVYAVIEIALGILMHTVDGRFSEFAYPSVVLAALFNLLAFSKSPRFIFNQVAFLFTLGADFFLVVRDDNYQLAMVLFAIAQLSYAARIFVESGKIMRRWQVTSRISVGAASLILPFIILGDGVDFLSVISVFYFGQLILNVVFAFVNIKRCGITLAVGLLLFLFCDIFVGFGNLGGYLAIERGSLIAWLARPPINMAWVFYLPSQALLGASLVFPLILGEKSKKKRV